MFSVFVYFSSVLYLRPMLVGVADMQDVDANAI